MTAPGTAHARFAVVPQADGTFWIVTANGEGIVTINSRVVAENVPNADVAHLLASGPHLQAALFEIANYEVRKNEAGEREPFVDRLCEAVMRIRETALAAIGTARP